MPVPTQDVAKNIQDLLFGIWYNYFSFNQLL